MRSLILVQLASAAVLMLLLLAHAEARRYPILNCRPCPDGDDCALKPGRHCPFGYSRDFCQNKVCAKGPGERCGKFYDLDGTCGDGLRCVDELCTGCSLEIAGECFSQEMMN